jgi:arginyl-tRNA synthetase
MKNQLARLVNQALPEILSQYPSSQLNPKDIHFEVELPKMKEHGDLSVNLAFQLSRKLKKNPFQIATQCQTVLLARTKGNPKLAWVKAITVEKPGFINFKVADLTIAGELTEIHKHDAEYGTSNVGKGEKVLIEFVSANPTGPLTIAHGRQAAVGDSLARIMETIGYRPHKEFYLNDAGRQIRLLGESLWVRYQEACGKSATLPEGGYEGAYLTDLAQALKAKKGDKLLTEPKEQVLKLLTQFAVEEMLSGVRADLKEMHVTFDEYFSEQSLVKNKAIDKALKKLERKQLTFEADGAYWFRSTKFGDDKDRVLRKKTGELTYLAPDIAYHESKFGRGYARLINLWGPDHHGYVGRLKAACEALGYSPNQVRILIVQLTTLYRGKEPIKMSTRKGKFVTLRELMDEVGVDATRFFFLLRKVASHLDFDLELAKQKTDENPVYYVQYAHARVSSLIGFAKRKVKRDVDLALIRSSEELELIKKMSEYPTALVQSAEHLEPYRIADYLRELSVAFHKFYAHHRVVSEDTKLTDARLLLVDCVRIVLRNGLELLGVSAPKSM